MDGTRRQDIRPGLEVEIVLKQDQATGKRTRGIVREILTPSPTHPHGIKVRLTSGAVGRVKAILTKGKETPGPATT
ncbi:MAG TPA: YwbE family protein [Thermoanaerobaculia bacterium]|nr:YwbE family protein [Thermoanaerobaculia bacterium]